MHDVPHPSRRRIVHQGAALGAASLGAPWLLGTAHAQADDLGPYRGQGQLAPGRGRVDHGGGDSGQLL
jgi:hypothetical protein